VRLERRVGQRRGELLLVGGDGGVVAPGALRHVVGDRLHGEPARLLAHRAAADAVGDHRQKGEPLGRAAEPETSGRLVLTGIRSRLSEQIRKWS
jgi:hypothetical protein